MNDRFTRGNEAKYVLEVLKRGALAPNGPMTERYERAFAEKMGVKHAFAVASTQAGMQMGLSYGNVGPGDEVITDATAYFSAQAILYMNAVPVFADIDPDTFNISPEAIEKRITPRTKAILCTHIFGLPCQMDRIMDIATRHDLVVIEDCAQAINSEHNGRKVGSFGHIGCYCMHDSKQVTSGDGGMAATNDDEVADVIRSMRGSDWLEDGLQTGRGGPSMRIGMELCCTELQAAVGLAQIERIEEILREHQDNSRRRIAFWNDLMGDRPYFIAQKVGSRQTHSYWHPAMKYVGDRYGVPLEKFRDALKAQGPEVNFGYCRPVYLTGRAARPGMYSQRCPLGCPHYAGTVQYEPGLCPVLEDTYWRLTSVFALGEGDQARKVHTTFWTLAGGKA